MIAIDNVKIFLIGCIPVIFMFIVIVIYYYKNIQTINNIKTIISKISSIDINKILQIITNMQQNLQILSSSVSGMNVPSIKQPPVTNPIVDFTKHDYNRVYHS